MNLLFGRPSYLYHDNEDNIFIHIKIYDTYDICGSCGIPKSKYESENIMLIYK